MDNTPPKPRKESIKHSKSHIRNASMLSNVSKVSSNAMTEDEEDDAFDSEEYVFIEREIQEYSGIQEAPSYQFPSTWDGAYHNTSEALREVTTASSSYYRAIADSGLSKAGWSIGGALAATANRSALSVASLAVNAAGANDKLPRGMRSWLQGKEKLDDAKRKAEEAERMRVVRKARMDLLERSGLIEVEPGVYINPNISGSRSRAGSMVHCRGSMYEEGFEGYGDLVGGQRRGSTLRTLSPNRLSADMSKFSITEERSDEADGGHKTDVNIKPSASNSTPSPNPWIGDSPISASPLSMYNPPASSSPSFEYIDTKMNAHPPKTPAHAKGILKNLDTPADVRRQLYAPFGSPSPTPHPAPMVETVKSPYNDSTEDEDPYFHAQNSKEEAARRKSSQIGENPHIISGQEETQGREQAGRRRDEAEDSLEGR
ncbi:hypothetical protein K504DRAFT_452679 [Pleomassaria siparia CBS 279.74]|uniref:Uncharacterized protein n=1 Tax=Pleomassaria siparia CBS 279.74 TaxID=1314801 RepID=A0A6G1KI26_9PLEO|nr:hypothetical protein K504DRAFT_452679 [Pleomassaria siparia CBS 279.74]